MKVILLNQINIVIITIVTFKITIPTHEYKSKKKKKK